MASKANSKPVVTVTGAIYLVLGIALAGGGAWLAALGGSVFYLIAGIGIVITAILLIARNAAALLVYAAVLAATLVWAVSEIGFQWWPLAARGDVIYPLALWLLTPWVTPITYAVDGKQFVVTAAGGHGSFGTRVGDYVIAYALPD